MNHCSLFHINLKRICIRLKFDSRRTRQMAMAGGNLKRNKRDGDLLHIYVVCLMKVPVGLEIYGGEYEFMDPLQLSHAFHSSVFIRRAMN
jgi:hypothetical protein